MSNKHWDVPDTITKGLRLHLININRKLNYFDYKFLSFYFWRDGQIQYVHSRYIIGHRYVSFRNIIYVLSPLHFLQSQLIVHLHAGCTVHVVVTITAAAAAHGAAVNVAVAAAPPIFIRRDEVTVPHEWLVYGRSSTQLESPQSFPGFRSRAVLQPGEWHACLSRVESAPKMAQDTDDINLTPQELQTLSELDRWGDFSVPTSDPRFSSKLLLCPRSAGCSSRIILRRACIT